MAKTWWILGCLAIVVLGGRAKADAPAPADLLLINGRIATASGPVSAMAISNGVIVALGRNEDLSPWRGAASRVIDLAGASVLPGLHDMHVHPFYAGMEQFACGLRPAASPEEIARRLTECVAKQKAGEWIQGGNWVAASFAAGQQNRGFLDRVAPRNPVMLNDEAHHSVWVNSLALQQAGITRDTPDPAGGIIEHDPSGEPNGLLRESAARLVQRVIPPPSEDAKRRALILATRQMLSFGVTSFIIASVRTTEIGTLADLSQEGLIKQHMRGCIVWEPGPSQANLLGEELLATRARYARPRFATDCVKIFLDGVPTESHTAAMIDPYEAADKAPHEERPEKGFLLIPQPVLDQAVTRFDRAGLQIKFHAAGDAAVRAAIDAVGAAREKNGLGGPWHDVAHCTFVDPADITRAGQVQLAWEFSPYIWYPTPIASVDILAAVGAERMKRWMPIREALSTGDLVVAGSDWSIVPSVNPWLAIETMVTREKPGGSAETLGSDERISLEQAIRIFTLNGARLMGDSDKVGSIEIGKHADLVVTEQNPFTLPIRELHAIKVKMTFVEGEKVFDAASPPPLTAN